MYDCPRCHQQCVHKSEGVFVCGNCFHSFTDEEILGK